MVVSLDFYYRDKQAFHLLLHVGQKGENTVLSTVPMSLLNKVFPRAMATIKYAHVPSQSSGELYLRMLAEKIVRRKELHVYFYPNYLLTNGRTSLEMAEQVINLQEILHFFGRTHYSAESNKVEFFVLTQTYLRKKRHILRTANLISRTDFEDRYLFNSEMEREFQSLNKSNIYLELVEEGQVEYTLVLDSHEVLRMFVCV